MSVNFKGALEAVQKGCIKHAPELFLFGGTTLMGLSLWKMHEATKKSVTLEKDIVEESMNSGVVISPEEVKKKARVKRVKLYGTVGLLSVASAGCYFMGNRISNKRLKYATDQLVSLATLYNVQQNAQRIYEDTVEKTVGVQKAADIRSEACKRDFEENHQNVTKPDNSEQGKQFLFIDTVTGAERWSTRAKIDAAVNTCNNRKNFGYDPYISYGEFLDQLDWNDNRPLVGDILGWPLGVMLEPKYTFTSDDEGNPVCYLAWYAAPQSDYKGLV